MQTAGSVVFALGFCTFATLLYVYAGAHSTVATQLTDYEPEPVTVVAEDLKAGVEVLDSDLTWMGEYQRADTMFSEALLPPNRSVLMFTRVFRIFGNGLLPVQQSLIDMQANVIALHCKILKLDCVGYLIPGDVPNIHQVLQQDQAERCQSICMIQIYSDNEQQQLFECPACASIQQQKGFERFDVVHAAVVCSITRDSHLPLAMRLKWSPTTSKAQLTANVVTGELPQLEQHVIHNPELARHIPHWQPYKALSITLEMQGPNVAPFTLGKQNLLLHIVRQLEKNYYVDGQTFRLGPCNHDNTLQRANATVIIVRSTHSGNVGLEKVLKSFRQQIQDSFNDAGLQVTHLHVSAPTTAANVTVPDQILAMIGPPSFWQQHRVKVWHAAAATLAMCALYILVKMVAALLYKANAQMLDSKSRFEIMSLWQAPYSSKRKRFLDDLGNKYARLLQMNLHAGLNDDSTIDLQVCQDATGEPWVLGHGACGIVYKAKRDGVQDVALKVLAAPMTERCQLQALKKEICLLRALSYDPNIVQFYGACLDPEFPLLVLEYMQGGDLREAIQQDFDSQPPKKFGWYGRGAKIALDVAKGLVFLHANKVVHSDIKSGNVLLNEDASIAKIADVGTSRLLEQTCTTGTMMCTFSYAAPEQMFGLRKACDEKVDVYSFGVVLWEIVAQDTARRGQLREAEVPAECPQSIEDLITACLSQSPADRPSAKEVCHILEQAMQMPPDLLTSIDSSKTAHSVFTRPASSLAEVSSSHRH